MSDNANAEEQPPRPPVPPAPEQPAPPPRGPWDGAAASPAAAIVPTPASLAFPTYGAPAAPEHGTPFAAPTPTVPPASPSAPSAYGGPGAYGTPPAYGYAAPYAPPAPTNGLAVTSMILGIAGLVLIWVVVPLLASIAAVITGHIALGQCKRNPQLGGRGMAIAGLILGYIGVAGLILIVALSIISFLFFGAFSLSMIPLMS